MPSKLSGRFNLEGPVDALIKAPEAIKTCLTELGVAATVVVTGTLNVSEVFEVDSLLDCSIRTYFADADSDNRSQNSHGLERIRNCFAIAKILTVGELVQKTPADLLKLNHFGQRSLDITVAHLAKDGLNLKAE